MKWKEFLKPDRRKVVFAILIGIFDIALFYFSLYSGLSETGYSINLLYYALKNFDTIIVSFAGFEIWLSAIIVWLLWALLGMVFYKYKMEKPRTILGMIIAMLILTSPFYYLLSCLIVWIYDKVKKK